MLGSNELVPLQRVHTPIKSNLSSYRSHQTLGYFLPLFYFEYSGTTPNMTWKRAYHSYSIKFLPFFVRRWCIIRSLLSTQVFNTVEVY